MPQLGHSDFLRLLRGLLVGLHRLHIGTLDSFTVGVVCAFPMELGLSVVPTLMDGCVIGRGSIVAPGCVVREGTVVPAASIVAGIPGKVIRERDSAHENRWNAWNYFRNAAAYRRGEHRAWDGEEYEKFSFEMREKIARDRDLEGDQTDAKT